MKNSYVILFLKLLRKTYEKIIGFKKQVFFNKNAPQYSGQVSSDVIYEKLLSIEPCMISRFGSVEFEAVWHYRIYKEKFLTKSIKFVKGQIESLNWPLGVKISMQNNAGFFPATNKNLDNFSELMLSEISNIDILGSWLEVENEFKNELEHVTTVGLEDLNAYNHEIPWTRALQGKKVLVIHPFIDSIKSQYKRREFIFENKDILPEFDLITYKPVVSFAGNDLSLKYKSWFEALEKMKNDISKINFDIALIGCGAYGLPLASFVKEIGKKSVHLGGATQMLFGIKGKRWETEYDLDHLFNEFWIRPSPEEIPNNANRVENACYW